MPPKAKKASLAGKGDPTSVVAEPAETSTTDNLLAALISGASVASTADVILSLYRETNADAAMCAVVNAVCKASGVQQVEIDTDALRQEGNIVTTLEELFARVPADSAAYFLANKDPKYKRFRKTFPEFFERLVLVAYSSEVLFDNTFMSVILQWLIAMTESKARSFRHTSTVALLGVMQGLNDRVVFVKESIQTLKKRDAATAQKTLDSLLGLLDHIFTTALHQRVKDVAPEIRLAVVQSLKQWCLLAPDIYVTNKYLRYFSVALYDKRPELRMEGLETIIQVLGHTEAAAPRMRDFLRYFADRLVEMVNDVDTKCADLAIKVAALIIHTDAAAGEGEDSATLNNDLIDRVLLSLFDERTVIRSTAGTFLKVFIRSRVDENDSEKLSTELLCTFASIFRTTYPQKHPERYLVDALWKNDNPPSILTHYKPILSLLQKDEEDEVVVALELFAAILTRVRDEQPLSFGPLAKDDLKVKSSGAPESGNQDFSASAFRVKLSKDVGVQLADVIERYEKSATVVAAVADVLAALDLHVFTTTKENSKLCEAFCAFRRAAASLSVTDTGIVAKLAAAWHAIAFVDYPQQEAAKVQFNDYVKATLSQLHAKDKSKSRTSSQVDVSQKEVSEQLTIWTSLTVISSLMPLKDQSVLLQGAFKRAVNAKRAPHLLGLMCGVVTHGILWRIAELEADPSLSPDSVQDDVKEALVHLLDVAQWSADSTRDEPGVLRTRCEAFGYFSDLASLPHASLTQQQQELFVDVGTELFDSVQGELKDHTQTLKDALKHVGAEASSIVPSVAARSTIISWEASLTRISMAVVRLLSFKKVAVKLGSQCLLLWTKSHVKVVSDIFKSLFHTLRDRTNDSFGLEKDVLLAAYRQSAEQAFNGAAVESLYQVGVKLSSMHFHPTDKYYPAAVQIVRWGIEFATTTDPTILNAISPYCSRLRQADALQVANSLHLHDLFVESKSTYAQAFVTAVRRAAKLEEPGVGSAAASATPWRTSKKRARELTVPSEEQPDQLLNEVTRAHAAARSPAAPPRVAKSSSRPAPSSSARKTTDDGWRVRPEDEQLLSQASAVGKPRSIPGTQESAALSTMLAELDDEVFIATQEFE